MHTKVPACFAATHDLVSNVFNVPYGLLISLAEVKTSNFDLVSTLRHHSNNNTTNFVSYWFWASYSFSLVVGYGTVFVSHRFRIHNAVRVEAHGGHTQARHRWTSLCTITLHPTNLEHAVNQCRKDQIGPDAAAQAYFLLGIQESRQTKNPSLRRNHPLGLLNAVSLHNDIDTMRLTS